MSLVTNRGYAVRASTSIGVAAGILVVTIATRLLFRKKQADGTIAPPVAPFGMLATFKGIGGSECPAFFLEMAKRCNSLIYQLNVPLLAMYVVGDYKAMREIFLECDKPADLTYSGFNILTGLPSVFSRSTNDPMWKATRKGCAPAFSSKEVNRMNKVCANKLSQWIETVLDRCVASGSPFDPTAEMSKLTFGILMESAFEYDMVTESEYDTFLHDLELSLREFTLKHSINPLRKWVVHFIPEGRRALQAVSGLHAYAKKILQCYRAKSNKAKENTLIKLIEGIPDFDDKQKIAEITVFLIAGHDTTGFSLGNALYLAALHPSETTKVRNSLSASNSPSQYFECFLSECNRLVPVTATGSARLAHRDFIFATPRGPMKIPKGSVFSMPQIVPNYDASVYDEPDEFRPERWLNATEEMKKSLLTFALGKRNCIGQSLATTELRSALPVLLSKYHFEVVKEGRLDYFLTLKYAGAQIKATKVTS